MTISDEALRDLAGLNGVVLQQSDLPSTLVEMCRIATRVIPGGDGASVTTFPEGRPQAVASDAWSQGFDELQYAEHEGPCLDAYRTGNAFRVRDLSAEPRWPSYVPLAVERGALSMMSLPMSAEGNTIGALNVYSRQVDAFDSEAMSVAEIVAAHAGLASQVAAALFHHKDLAAQLAEAMRSRAVIEQAKGILMATHKCDADTAFSVLKRESQNSNVKLRDLAARVVADASRP